MPVALALLGGVVLGVAATLATFRVILKARRRGKIIIPGRPLPSAYVLPGQLGTAVYAGGNINICSGRYGKKARGFGENGKVTLVVTPAKGVPEEVEDLKVAADSWHHNHIGAKLPDTLAGFAFDPRNRADWPKFFVRIRPAGEHESRAIVGGPIDIRDPDGGRSGFPPATS